MRELYIFFYYRYRFTFSDILRENSLARHQFEFRFWRKLFKRTGTVINFFKRSKLTLTNSNPPSIASIFCINKFPEFHDTNSSNRRVLANSFSKKTPCINNPITDPFTNQTLRKTSIVQTSNQKRTTLFQFHPLLIIIIDTLAKSSRQNVVE